MLTRFFPGAGGGLLRPESNSSDPDARQNIIGSFIIIQAESIEAVWEMLKKEIFYTSGEVVCEVVCDALLRSVPKRLTQRALAQWDREKVFVAPVYVPFKEAKFE